MTKLESGQKLFKGDSVDFNQSSAREQAVFYIGLEQYSKEYFLESSHNSIIEHVYTEFSKDDFRVPHDFIARLIYRDSDFTDITDIESINKNLKLFLDEFRSNSGYEKDIKQIRFNFERLSDSIQLCITQKKYIKDQAQSVIDEAKKLQQENNEINNQLQKTRDKLIEANNQIEEIKNLKGSVYTDFIAILSVFSAFVFLGFGGISLVQAIYDLGLDMIDIPLSNMVMVSSFMLIVVLTMMYSILYWLSRIIDRKIENHKFYITLMIILAVISVISSVIVMNK